MNNEVVFCPNCKEPVIIEQINCGIFRHGVKKSDGQQMAPHLNKEECEKLIKQNLIYGCGKPFQIEIINGNIEIKICDYI